LKFAQALIYLAALWLWACTGAPTPTAVPPSPTPAPTRIPATFPPTWTPTDTHTPLPPSPTNTPSPTRSPTPTPGPEQIERICENFRFNYTFDRGETFEQDARIAFGVETQQWDVVVRFLAVHRLTGENRGLQIPSGQYVLAEMPVSLLPRPGLYDWTISVHHDELGDFCTQGGYFFVRSVPTQEVTQEPEATETPVFEG
jgi:hypothetical protein